ncbi:MAG TPA: HoxN/HupN/NixA family nickel/cobalt transporter [Thermoplasmata archaeon]|nr:HoxN/HupN/NixA family nickel/cobalt transporter [Thermoplasmata archaeon]
MVSPRDPLPIPGAPVLTRREQVSVGMLYAAIGGVTIAAFGLLVLIAGRYDTPGTLHTPAIAFLGLGIASYVFGLRHGVDADHIAAIDNTTRKLLHEKKRPLTVGTWFSLGHSTIVVGLIVALVFATQVIEGQIPALRTAGGVIGTTVSGAFLFLIGLINVVVVVEVYRIFQGLKRGAYSEEELEAQLTKRGFMNRFFGRLFRLVETPRQIYPIGLLFGLGFDTASEIALIAISVAVAATAIPLYVVLVLPLLFTCGMVLVDTTDGITMRFAYGWAFLKPIRKIYYNLTVTVISVLVAFVVGGFEILTVLSGELGLTGGFWDLVDHLSFEGLGFAIVAVFVGTWGIAMAYYRYKRYDQIPFGPGSPPAGSMG